MHEIALECTISFYHLKSVIRENAVRCGRALRVPDTASKPDLVEQVWGTERRETTE